MALVIPEGFFQASVPFVSEFVLRPAICTFGISEPTTPVTPAALADLVMVAVGDAIDPIIDPNVTMGPVTLTFDQAPGQRGSISGAVVRTGDRTTTNSTSPQIAAIFKKQTNRVGRPGRGRMFVPWAGDRDDVDEAGRWTNTWLDDLAIAAVNLLDNLQTIDASMVILHDEDVPGSTDPSTVTNLLADPQTGTQRRRNRS